MNGLALVALHARRHVLYQWPLTMGAVKCPSRCMAQHLQISQLDQTILHYIIQLYWLSYEYRGYYVHQKQPSMPHILSMSSLVMGTDHRPRCAV